jgi:hypothetical protein
MNATKSPVKSVRITQLSDGSWTYALQVLIGRWATPVDVEREGGFFSLADALKRIEQKTESEKQILCAA